MNTTTTQESEHEWFGEQIATYLTNGLSADELARFESHAATCERCADELAQMRERDASRLPECLLPIEAGLADWTALPLDEHGAEDVAHGRALRVTAAPGRYRAHTPSGSLLAIGDVDATGTFRVLRGFMA